MSCVLLVAEPLGFSVFRFFGFWGVGRIIFEVVVFPRCGRPARDGGRERQGWRERGRLRQG